MEKIISQGFDRDVWNELLDLFGRDGVGEMVDTLRRDLPRQRRQLIEALQDDARAPIRNAAHNLRGVALQFGAAGLADDCGELERHLDAGTALDVIAPQAAQMLDRLEALTRALREALDAG